MSVNRDALNKALEVLRKKDPQNATLQKFDEYLRSFSGNKDTTPYGSIKLWDNWNTNVNSANEEKRLMSSKGKKMVQNLDGTWQSAGYDKAIEKQKAAHDAVVKGLADPSTDPVNMDIYNAAQKKLKADQEAMQKKLTDKKTKQTGHEPTDWWHQNVMNPINDALGSAYDHTLGPVNDFIDRMAASGVNELTAGQFKKHINDKSAEKALGPAAQKFASDLSADPTTKTQKAADVLGSLYASAPAFMGIGKVTEPLAQLATANRFGQAAIRDGLAMGLYSGAKNAVDASINPNDETLKQRLTDVGLNTAFGAALGTGIEAVSPLASRIFSKIASGKTVEQVAKEEGMNPKDVADMYDYTGRTFQRESSGEVIDGNAPRLNAPTPEPTLGIDGPSVNPNQLGQSPLGLNEPIINRSFNTGKPVEVKGTPQLNAPENLPQMENDLKQIYDLRKAEEDAHVQQQMAPHIETQKKQAEAQAVWDHVVKTAKEEIARIKGTYGKIHVPKDDRGSYDIPKQFRASLGDAHSDDIHSFATQEGFSSTDEAVQYLHNLEKDSKVKLKDIMPEGKPMSEDVFNQLEQAARDAYRKSGKGQALDNLFSNLMKTYDETASSYANDGTPLAFKKEKGFVANQEPVSYVGQMNPKDQVATRAEGSYSTRQADSPTGDTLKMNVDHPNPEQPLQFKTQVEQQPFKKTIQKEVTRKDVVEVDGRKPKQENVNNSQTKPETSSNLDPLGIVPGQAHVNDISWIENPSTLADRIKSGDVSLKDTVQKVKTHMSSDLQFVKDVMRTIAEQDMGETLQMMGRKLKDVAFEDNLFKGLRSVRRAMNEAIKASKQDYGKILKDLRANNISKTDAEEYFSAVHFRDVLVHNRAKMERAGEVDARLEEIQKLIQNTKDKKVLQDLGKEEDALLKEKSDLEPYVLPKEATPEKIQAVLDRWKDTPAMINAQREFIMAQRKDLEMMVQSGLKSQAQVDAMIAAHPNYIYMGRADHELTPSNMIGNISRAKDPLKRRGLGSEENLKYSPMDAAIRNRMITYHNVRRNEAMSIIEKLSQAKGGDEFFTRLNPHTASSSQKANAVKFFKDGEPEYYQVDPVMKQAFNNLDTRQAQDLASKMMRSIQNVIKRGSTHYNLDFIFASPFRETNALITSRTGLHPGELVLGYLDSFMGKNLEKWSGGFFKSYKDMYSQMGGHYSGYVSTDPKDVSEFMKAMDKGSWGKGLEFINPKHWIETVGQNMDHGPKLAEFRSAKKAGYSNKDAMHEAVDVFDYNDLGTTTRAVNNYVPYFGPAIKGTTRYFQAAKENPAAWLGKNIAYITAPTVSIYMLRFAPWATDEQRSKINNMADYKKNMTWAIPAPNGKSVWLIPKMHVGAQIFANPVERILDQVFQQNPKTAQRMMKDTAKDFGSVYIPPDAIAGVSLLYDVTANYNRLLQMPIEDKNMQANPDKTQHFNSYTSEVAKWLGQVSGQSPAKIDYAVKGATGGAGRDALDIMDNLMASLKGERPSKTQTNLDILNPINRYKLDNSASLGTYNRLTGLSKQNEWDRKQLRAALGESKLPKNDINKIDDAYKELNKAIAAIREATGISASEKKQKISALRDQQRKLGDILINSGMLRNY